MKFKKTILIIDDNLPFMAAVKLALNDEYIFVPCETSYASIKRYIAQPDAAKYHAVMLNGDIANNDGVVVENALSIVEFIRGELKCSRPIVLFSLNNMVGLQKEENALFLNRKGNYFIRQPFLLSDLIDLLEKVEKCDSGDASEYAKTQRIIDYRRYLNHEIIEKVQIIPIKELEKRWEKISGGYHAVGIFKEEILTLEESLKKADKGVFEVVAKKLLAKADDYIAASVVRTSS